MSATTSSQSAADFTALHKHRQQQRHVTPAELFAAPQRFADFSLSLPGLLVDFSKTTLTNQTIDLLLNLAEQSQVFARRDMLFGGDVVNVSENRAALHFALRADADANIQNNGENIMPQIVQSRDAMLHFADALRNGEIVAADGKPFTDFLNIGIGGSDLGPAMASAALHGQTDGKNDSGLRPHFVSNMDGAHFADVVDRLSPQRTLVYISSKTFGTAETLANARAACEWLAGSIGAENVSAHLAAATAAPDNIPSFLDVQSARIFSYPQTIGGRYSVWGSVGLPLAAAFGSAQFMEFLRGARDMDMHFCQTAPRQNIPLMLALIGIWHRNICGYASRAVLPFDHRLRLFPSYVQQLEMESNGKNVQQNGQPITMETVPAVWGSTANNAQHAYFQMLHQGSDIIPCDFLADGGNEDYAATLTSITADEYDKRRRWLLSNCLAQSAALFFGDSSPDLPARKFAGARPSVVILYQKLTPYTLGQLLAMYEHRVFVEGAIWNINSFDQWGVELGKTLAKTIHQQIDSGQGGGQDDSSTRGLIAHCQEWRENNNGK